MIDHIGDILAIPFFAWLTHYFYFIPFKRPQDYILLIFSFLGLLADILFSIMFLTKIHKIHYYLGAILYFLFVFKFFEYTFKHFER